MDQDRRNQLRELVRTEPTIVATLAEWDAARERTAQHLAAIDKRRGELLEQLSQISSAKDELAAVPVAAAAPAHEEPEVLDQVGEHSDG